MIKSMVCVVCETPFEYDYRGGRERRFCSPACKKDRRTALQKRRRRIGNEYPIQIESPLPEEEMEAVIEATDDAYWRRRPSPADIHAAAKNDFIGAPLEPGQADRPDIAAETEPSYRVSVVRGVLDLEEPLSSRLIDVVAPHEPTGLYGIGAVTAQLGYAGGSANIRELKGRWRWDDPTPEDRERRPLKHPWFRSAGFPAAGLDVGETGDIAKGPGVTDEGVAEYERWTTGRPARFQNWSREEQFTFMPIEIRRSIRCHSEPIPSMKPFVKLFH